MSCVDQLQIVLVQQHLLTDQIPEDAEGVSGSFLYNASVFCQLPLDAADCPANCRRESCVLHV